MTRVRVEGDPPPPGDVIAARTAFSAGIPPQLVPVVVELMIDAAGGTYLGPYFPPRIPAYTERAMRAFLEATTGTIDQDRTPDHHG